MNHASAESESTESRCVRCGGELDPGQWGPPPQWCCGCAMGPHWPEDDVFSAPMAIEVDLDTLREVEPAPETPEVVLIRIESLLVRCRVISRKVVYGRKVVKVSPVEGEGEMVVREDRICKAGDGESK